MVFFPTFSGFFPWIQIFWKKTKINLVSEYFPIYLSEQLGLCQKARSEIKWSLLKIFYIDKLLFLASLLTSHSVTINTNALACLLYAVLSACRKSVVTDLGGLHVISFASVGSWIT